MMLHIALFIISSAGGEGASCRIDADCMGGLGCTTDRVCVQLRAPPPRDDVSKTARRRDALALIAVTARATTKARPCRRARTSKNAPDSD